MCSYEVLCEKHPPCKGALVKMGDTRDICPHLDSIGEVTRDDLLLKSKGTCQSCGAVGPNLWACLQIGCPYVGCGESFADHSTLHAQAKKHNLTVNLTTFRVWCYACEKEVFLDQRLATHTQSPPVKFTDPVGLSQRGRVELLAGFPFTCCKMNQWFLLLSRLLL